MEGGAYGGAPAGSKLNPLKIITKPQLILRLVSFVLCIIVIGCDGSKPKGATDTSYACLYLSVGGNKGSCVMTMVVAVIAFLATIAFLVMDVLFDCMSNVKTRKILVLCDLVFSGLWTFMWFVSFCYLANSVRISNNSAFPIGAGQAKATVAFVFFSLIVWAALTVHAVLRFRQGSESAFSQNYEHDPSAPPPPQATGGDSYQEPPFAQKTDLPEAQHQAPTY